MDTFFFIPHTHWEGAVFKTRAEYLDIGLPNITRALRLLKKYPQYRFVLDQACYVRPFLERYPEEEAAFRQFIAEGRLVIAGGTDSMPDDNMPAGETFVRQMLYGKGYFRQKLGVEVTAGWLLDTFGHNAQMPQLFKLAGYKSHWFFRGVPTWDTPSEFLWEGLDGTRLPAYWLSHGYALTYFSPKTEPEFGEFMKKQYEALAPFTHDANRVGLAGADVSEPEEHVPPLIEAFNQRGDAPFILQIALPGDYEAAVEKRPAARPVVKGELNPIFQGAYSSRIELKQRTREVERLLTAAEKLGVFLRWQGQSADDDPLLQAWEPMLFNHAHDLMSGVMTDHVYEDTLRSYDFSQRLASTELQSRLESLVASIDTRGEGKPLVVFNPLSWPRTDIAYAQVAFSADDILDVALTGPDGQPVPVQILQAERYANGALLDARIAFIASDVPALGFAVYHLAGLKTAPVSPDHAAATVSAPGDAWLENEACRLELDPASGAITRLSVKAGGWEALAAPGNVIAMEEDHGDLWEPYHSLDGGSRIAMKDRHLPPAADKAVLSTTQAGEPGLLSRGPVVSEFSVSHPFSTQGRFQTTVRLFAGLERIEIHTRLLNQDRFVRYRAFFPSTIDQGQITREIPFGAIQQPDGIEFPAQNWLDYGDGQRGLALLNRGLPGNNAADGTLILSLLRSTCIVAYGFGGGYEPGMSSDSGFEEGKELSFDYALLPHAGSWSQAGVFRSGLEFNQPLMAIAAPGHPGSLPSRWGFLEVRQPNIVVSALKAGADGCTILRFYEAAGTPAQGVEIKFSQPVASAEEVNLMEDPGQKLDLSNNTLRLDFRPFEIKTVKITR